MKAERAMLAVFIISIFLPLLSFADSIDKVTIAASEYGITDKDLHRAVSFSLGTSLYTTQVWARDLREKRKVSLKNTFPILSSGLACVAVGRIKEEFDMRVDPNDLQANLTGCAFGVLTAAIIDNETFKITTNTVVVSIKF